QDERFTYPYIHFNKRTMHLPLEQRVREYTKLADQASEGTYGRFLLNSIWSPDHSVFYGATIVIATDENDPLFKAAKPRNKAEIGAFTHPDHQEKGIATQGLHQAIGFAINNWGITGLCASMGTDRPASIAISERLGMEQVAFFKAGSKEVPYNNKDGKPAARIIMGTPDGCPLKDYLKL
ncbi:MAG TPA: GNAT family N-acetyltransferase, partial [Alphaproteobacteria bacterium]